jgi:hypothetical protein
MTQAVYLRRNILKLPGGEKKPGEKTHGERAGHAMAGPVIGVPAAAGLLAA